MSSASQFSLLKSRRFLPYFMTQALGAFNDNLYKIPWEPLNNSVPVLDCRKVLNHEAGLQA